MISPDDPLEFEIAWWRLGFPFFEMMDVFLEVPAEIAFLNAAQSSNPKRAR
jgi:hypothetical protein